MTQIGVANCIGICELPGVTAGAIAAELNVPIERLSWSYSGLNHRGFLHSLEVNGRDVLPDLLKSLGDRSLFGVPASTIEELDAVPTKYFASMLRQPVRSVNRALELRGLASQILRELKRSVATVPPSLRKRYLEWYRCAVIPLILALHGSDSRREVVKRG